MVESVHGIIEWRERWVSKQVRACTKYFKVEVFNSWARTNCKFAELLRIKAYLLRQSLHSYCADQVPSDLMR